MDFLTKLLRSNLFRTKVTKILCHSGWLYRFGRKLSRCTEPTFFPLNAVGNKVIGEFITCDNRRILLHHGYRDRIKNRWRLGYWPTRALLSVRDRLQLSPSAENIVKALVFACTLPAGLDEIAEIVVKLSDKYPRELIKSEMPSKFTKIPIIAARMTKKQISSLAYAYYKVALTKLFDYFRWKNTASCEKLSVLEVGCGMGYAVIAMAALQVNQAVGIDSVNNDYRFIYERPAISAKLGLGNKNIARRTKIITADITHMPFDDNQFDLIFSSSVLEHIQDLEKAFIEMKRLLKPGGLMIHDMDPYFSPRGGHSFCTLDFPWGHARLTSQDFKRYIRQFRPFEYEHAVVMYENLFNKPRFSLHQIEQVIGKVGLNILSWNEYWMRDHLPSNNIWKEVSIIHSSVGMRDLATSTVNLVLNKV